MKIAEESDRYNYPQLNPQSIVMDCGGYEGGFARSIRDKYGCKVFVFEPVFYAQIPSGNGIFTFPVGVGGSSRVEWFTVRNDSTGILVDEMARVVQKVEIFDISQIIRLFDERIDLLKLNIEGMEYECLNSILANDMQTRVKNFQIQFHRIEDCEQKRRAIVEKLSETHELVYFTEFVWEGWKLK